MILLISREKEDIDAATALSLGNEDDDNDEEVEGSDDDSIKDDEVPSLKCREPSCKLNQTTWQTQERLDKHR